MNTGLQRLHVLSPQYRHLCPDRILLLNPHVVRVQLALIVTALCVVVLATAASGCGAELELQGTALNAPEGRIAVRWGEAGRGLVFGEGRAEDGRFWVQIPDRPPPAAVDNGQAVGQLVIISEQQAVRLGAPLTDVRGELSQVRVVYQEAASDALPAGFSCARPSEGGLRRIDCHDISVAD